MIKRIIKLKNFGIFHDFTWDSCPEFKRFNLIYGWNRSGKTTLSRVFSACERKSTDFTEYPVGGEFDIKVDSGTSIKNSTIAGNEINIRVFNHDFIEEHISFDPSDSCNPIVLIGAIAKKDKETLDKLRKANPVLRKDSDNATKNRRSKEDIKNNFLTGLGREVANFLFDKTFNKTKVAKCIENIGIDNFSDKIIADDEKDKYESISRSKSKDKLPAIETAALDFEFDNKKITDFKSLNKIVRELLEREIESESLDRLKKYPDLNSWVKQGYDLHKSHDEKEKCLFCESRLPSDLLNTLSKHFSEDYDKLQTTLTTILAELSQLKRETIPSRDKELYPDLITEFNESLTDTNGVMSRFNTWIDEVILQLKEKQQNPLSKVTLPSDGNDLDRSVKDSATKLNAIIARHNSKVENHEDEVSKAKDVLEKHLIAVAVAEQNYKQIKNDLTDAIKEDDKANKKLAESNKSIQALKEKSSSIGNAIEKINKHLEGFFGRKEIQLVLDDSQKGYIIKRDGQIANNLSEGEKTAIAFSYFIVKTHERDFKIKEGVIFIDDPISSFDSNFIYHCFSLVTNHFKEARQLFVATHNFEFFNLMKDWLCRKHKTDEVCAFHMIETYPVDDRRYATLKELDNTLKKFKSEYHYLFYLLCRFTGKAQPEYEDFYTIGNIARRFLEIFINFKVPRSGDLRGKVDEVVKDINSEKAVIEDTDKDKVYKLVQEYSHGNDPISMIEHKDKGEIKEAVRLLLVIIENSDPKHYKVLINTQ